MNTIAVIGLGNIARRHRQNLKMLFPQAKIIALSASGRCINQPIEFSDILLSNINELIDCNPELVIIASPASFHEKYANPLIINNIPILIEKPLTSEPESAHRILAIAKEHNCPIMIGYCLRYLSSAIFIKQLILNNYIGKIYNCSATVGQYLPDWRPNKHYSESVSAQKSLGGGALLELSHELDYLLWLLGPLTLKYAQLRTTNELALEVEEIADLVLTSQQGTVCYIHMDFIQKQAQRECTFIGSTGRLRWDLLTNTIHHYHSDGTQVLYSQPEWNKNQMYLNMVTDFISHIKNKHDSNSSLVDAYQTVCLIAKIKDQADWGATQ
ncbi:MAG: Gfo/Idh/MocA family protein [Shewanella sp.]